MSVHDCLVGAAETAAPPGRTPIKNLPRISQMRTDQEGICEICGRIFSTRNFCEFGEFCGRTSEGGVGMAGMPYPPTKTPTDCTLSLQKKAIRLNNQGKTMIAKDGFVPLL